MSWLKLRRSKSIEKRPARGKRRGWTRMGRVYILPTKFGFAFTAGSVFMLLIGSAYENNLVNLLGFFMLAVLFTAMIATHSNIKGIEISRIETVQGFSGETFPVSVIIHNPTRTSKSNCEFTIRGFKKLAQYDARAVIPPKGETRLLASFDAPTRGLHPLDQFAFSTTAPFGLFYAWLVQPSDAVAVIYPRRSGSLTWANDLGAEVGSRNRVTGAEDYKEHRTYQAGDNLRRVDWKAFARGRPLMTKEFDEPAGQGLHFDFLRLTTLEHERRLEQMTKWIDLAIQQGRAFTVSLPGKKMGPDQGLSFAHRAWGELARFDDEHETPESA